MKHKYKKQVHLGYDSEGKQIRKWFYGETKSELNANIQKYRNDLERLQNPSDITFRDYSDQWFRTYKENRAKQTKDMYRNALKKCGRLDPVPLKKITRSMCQETINTSWEYPSAAEVLSDTLKQIFKCAIRDGIILANPADALDLPKKPQAAFHLLTKKEMDAFDKAELNDQDRLFVTIMKFFGLRPAEALALGPTDFDLDAGILHVTKALELANDNQEAVKMTKTEVSRDIPIPKQLIAPLRERFRTNPGFLLFPKRDKGLYTKSAYRRLCERILTAVNLALGGNENLNLIPDVTIYCLRHRRATDLYYQCQKGVISTKKAAYLMGHSEEVFLKTYSHIDDSKEHLEQIYDGMKAGNL